MAAPSRSPLCALYFAQAGGGGGGPLLVCAVATVVSTSVVDGVFVDAAVAGLLAGGGGGGWLLLVGRAFVNGGGCFARGGGCLGRGAFWGACASTAAAASACTVGADGGGFFGAAQDGPRRGLPPGPAGSTELDNFLLSAAAKFVLTPSFSAEPDVDRSMPVSTRDRVLSHTLAARAAGSGAAGAGASGFWAGGGFGFVAGNVGVVVRPWLLGFAGGFGFGFVAGTAGGVDAAWLLGFAGGGGFCRVTGAEARGAGLRTAGFGLSDGAGTAGLPPEPSADCVGSTLSGCPPSPACGSEQRTWQARKVQRRG